jgi:hypothetical protein
MVFQLLLALCILRGPAAAISNPVMKMFNFIAILSLKANSLKISHRMEEDLSRYVT